MNEVRNNPHLYEEEFDKYIKILCKMGMTLDDKRIDVNVKNVIKMNKMKYDYNYKNKNTINKIKKMCNIKEENAIYVNEYMTNVLLEYKNTGDIKKLEMAIENIIEQLHIHINIYDFINIFDVSIIQINNNKKDVVENIVNEILQMIKDSNDVQPSYEKIYNYAILLNEEFKMMTNENIGMLINKFQKKYVISEWFDERLNGIKIINEILKKVFNINYYY